MWILQLSDDQLAPYLDALTEKDPAGHPLWGIPFAVKVNIDIRNLPTTAGCATELFKAQYRLQDLAAISIPARFTISGLPFGVTLVGNTFSDRVLLSMANRLRQAMPLPQGASQLPQPGLNTTPVTDPTLIDIVVCGAHLSGLPHNHQLIERGGVMQQRTCSTRGYRLYVLPDGLRPALIRDQSVTSVIEVEVWRLPMKKLGSLFASIASPLGIGKVVPQDDRQSTGFICEAGGECEALDITEYGGWRAYLNSKKP